MSTHQLPVLTGVVGGGRMGAGIAHALLLAGSHVVLIEADDRSVETARSHVLRAVEQSDRRGTLTTTVSAVTARFEVQKQISALRGTGLVIEAVPEDLRLKSEVLVAIEGAVDDEAVIATNTSSLPVGELAALLRHPARFLGLHFFNPVPASKLVEIVVGQRTSDELVEHARTWVGGLGKTPVVVRDSPGFASSRLGVLLGLEAIRMLEQGVATAEDIDAAMVLGYHHPVGPLRLTDMVGLDVRLGISRYLAGALGPRFDPPQLLIDKVDAGELGRKSGAGFYLWKD